MDAYRSALAAGTEPLLVVPMFADVDVYRRELAATGAVFGVQVVRFGSLLGEIARRAGLGGRPLGMLARERVAAAAVARTKLEALARSAATPGFVAALLRLVDELEELRLDPPRVIAALRRWAEDEPARACLRRRARGAVRRLPPRARPGQGGRSPAARRRGARRAAGRPRALGPDAGRRLRLRRPVALAARRDRDARLPRRRRRHPDADLRARAHRAGGARLDVRAAARAAGRQGRRARGARRALRDPRAAPPGAHAVRDGGRPVAVRRRDRPGRDGAATARGRRAARRGRAGRGRGRRAAARRLRARGGRGRLALAGRRRRARRGGLRGLRHPDRARPGGCVRETPRWVAACSRCCAARCARAAPTT